MRLVISAIGLASLLAALSMANAGSITYLIGDKDGFGIGAKADETFAPTTMPGYDGPGDGDGTDKWFYNQQSFSFTYDLPFLSVNGAQLEVLTGGQGYNPFDIYSGAPTSVFLNDTLIGYLTIGDFAPYPSNYARNDVLDLAPFLGLLTGNDTFRFRPFATGSAFGDGWVMDYLELTLFVDDADNDRVTDDIDQCPNTVIPESVPTSVKELGNNRYALMEGGSHEFTGGIKTQVTYSTLDTAGCSCEQIVATLGLGEGQLKYGCSRSVMDAWIMGLP